MLPTTCPFTEKALLNRVFRRRGQASWVPSEEQSKSRCGSPRSPKKATTSRSHKDLHKKSRCKSFAYNGLQCRGERIWTFGLLVANREEGDAENTVKLLTHRMLRRGKWRSVACERR